jgi:hypothetical protein
VLKQKGISLQGTFLDQKKLVSYKIYFLLEYFSYRDMTYLGNLKAGAKKKGLKYWGLNRWGTRGDYKNIN